MLRDWEASGVSTFMTGSNVNPTCNTNLSGIANEDPTLTGAPIRCELVPGQDIDDIGAVDASVHDAFQPHFNLDAFRRPLPNGATGNNGNSVQGELRHPGWQNWDFTLARRIPVNIGRGGSVRVQAQFYNVFDLTQFQRLAATYTFAPQPLQPVGQHEHDDGRVRRSDQPVQLRDHDPHGLLDRIRRTVNTHPGPTSVGPGFFIGRLGVQSAGSHDLPHAASESAGLAIPIAAITDEFSFDLDVALDAMVVRRDDRRRASRHRRPQHPRSDRRRGGSPPSRRCGHAA